MLLNCDQKELLAALSVVSKAVNLNNTLPVLSNILLKAENKKLSFAATNLEIAITTSIVADVKNEGAMTVPARLFTSFVALLPSGKVELASESGLDLRVKAAKSQTRIKGISADEFPLIPQVKRETSLTLLASDLLEGLQQVAFSAAKDLVRPVLAGVYLHADKKEVRLAATDSYRLSEKILKPVELTSDEVSIIIPARTAAELTRIIEKSGKETITLDISANQILFLYKNIELASRLIEGVYPDYGQIVPRSHKTQVLTKTEELATAVKRVALFAKDSHNIKLVIADKKLEVLTDASQIGEETAEVAATIAGADTVIGLNANYLQEALSALGTTDLAIELSDKTAPVIFKPAKGADYLHLIMPLKV